MIESHIHIYDIYKYSSVYEYICILGVCVYDMYDRCELYYCIIFA